MNLYNINGEKYFIWAESENEAVSIFGELKDEDEILAELEVLSNEDIIYVIKDKFDSEFYNLYPEGGEVIRTIQVGKLAKEINL